MKLLIVPALLAAAATQADAGDVKFGFGFDWRHHIPSVHVRIGHGHGRRHHRARAYRCGRTWVNGYHEVVRHRTWTPAHYDRVFVAPRYGHRYDACGYRVRTIVRHGYHRNVHVPGHWDVHREKIWHRGHWNYNCNTPGHHH